MGKGDSKKKTQLNVRVTRELKRRVTITADAREESVGKFVSDLLDKRTEDNKDDIDSIVRREQKRL